MGVTPLFMATPALTQFFRGNLSPPESGGTRIVCRFHVGPGRGREKRERGKRKEGGEREEREGEKKRGKEKEEKERKRRQNRPK